MLDEVVTVCATPNMALVKYWGKRRLGEDCNDPALNLPRNSSLSITLDAGSELLTRTSIVFSRKLKESAFYLDGKKQDLKNPELQERFLAFERLRELSGVDAKVLVVSKNSFPTASGLASSASGLAAFVLAAAKALGLKLSNEELSGIARIGSGSACRSLFGGFVKWSRGSRPDGSDSIATQVFDEKHWPGFVDVIAIASQEKKKISSRAGMRQTVETSELYKLFTLSAETDVGRISDAIRKRDFDATGRIIMSSSMMMHATMLDTKPPIMYLNDVSRRIIYAMEELNATEGRIVAAYTFDAGPNANIITLEKDRTKVQACLGEVDGIEKVFAAKVGSGPKALGSGESLIDEHKLVPKATGK